MLEIEIKFVATVLTVYGIETQAEGIDINSVDLVATVLTVYGIETFPTICRPQVSVGRVATVLTVYGIETGKIISQD